MIQAPTTHVIFRRNGFIGPAEMMAIPRCVVQSAEDPTRYTGKLLTIASNMLLLLDVARFKSDIVVHVLAPKRGD